MRSMRWLAGALVACAALVSQRSVVAGPVAYASWQICDVGVVTHNQMAAGGSAYLWLWIYGVDFAHAGYRARIEFASADGLPVPDAWRFDASGCQPSGTFAVEYRTPLTTTGCRKFYSGYFPSSQTTIGYDGATRRMTVTLELDYPSGETGSRADWYYFLAAVHFDQYFGVFDVSLDPSHCGGLDRRMCFQVKALEVEHLGGGWEAVPVVSDVLTASSLPQADFGCDLLPARLSSWGAVKGTYR